MPLTEVQIAKLTVEIDKLGKEAEALEREARLFELAAKTYGSELAGSSGTAHLFEKARLTRENRLFLLQVRNGEIDLQEPEHLQQRLARIEEMINHLAQDREELLANVEKFQYARKVLGL